MLKDIIFGQISKVNQIKLNYLKKVRLGIVTDKLVRTDFRKKLEILD